jgi:hypothetical protein
MKRTISLGAAVLLVTSCAGAQAGSSPSPAVPRTAASLPHDQHEGLTVSADPYLEAARAKEKFGKANPLPAGILPVEVFLHNETAQPIRIPLNAIQLVIHFPDGQHQNLDRLAAANVAGVVAHPGGSPTPHASRFPVGLGGGADHKADKLAEILVPLALDADIVPPRATIHGFLFFNLGRDLALARDASLYLPEATTVPSNRPLMFFEVFFGTPAQP